MKTANAGLGHIKWGTSIKDRDVLLDTCDTSSTMLRTTRGAWSRKMQTRSDAEKGNRRAQGNTEPVSWEEIKGLAK